MHADDADRDHIDLLVRELMTKSQPAPPPAPLPAAAERRPGSRWSSVQLLMPRRRLGRRFSLPFTIALPPLPDVRRFISVPSSVTIVRMWVALGVAQGAAMIYWPYEKTYWGLVLYLLCLGVSLVNGVWGARLSWDARLGAAHTVSIGTTFWAVTLAATEAARVV